MYTYLAVSIEMVNHARRDARNEWVEFQLRTGGVPAGVTQAQWTRRLQGRFYRQKEYVWRRDAVRIRQANAAHRQQAQQQNLQQAIQQVLPQANQGLQQAFQNGVNQGLSQGQANVQQLQQQAFQNGVAQGQAGLQQAQQQAQAAQAQVDALQQRLTAAQAQAQTLAQQPQQGHTVPPLIRDESPTSSEDDASVALWVEFQDEDMHKPNGNCPRNASLL